MIKYLNLIRFDKPAGTLLLFWPCAFFLALNIEHLSRYEFIKLLIVFFIGAFVARSAGCIINDIFDKDIDRQVARTKYRPIANGDITVKQAFTTMLVLLVVALLLVLVTLKISSVLMCIYAFVGAIFYPLTKRFFILPQLVLAVVYNSGVLVLSNEITGVVTTQAIFLYMASIFWTMAYDTIYALQDIDYDRKIGIKSSAIFFGENVWKFVVGFYFMQYLLLVFAVGEFGISNIFFAVLFLVIFYNIYGKGISKSWQEKRANPQDYALIFRNDAYFMGVIIFLVLLIF